MPLGRKLEIGSEEARRRRAELRTSYGNKLSDLNLERLRGRSMAASSNSSNSSSSDAICTATMAMTTTLRRIASSFAHVSDVDGGSCAALPLEDTEEDAREARAEVLIRSEPFQTAEAAAAAASAPTVAGVPAAAAMTTTKAATSSAGNQYLCDNLNQSRASERWSQIAGTVSTLFRVRRISEANPLSEVRRLREQRDLLEAFTRPFICEDAVRHK